MDQPTNQLKMENAISQGKFLDLVNLVSKTLCTFLILSFTYKLMALHHFGAASSNTEQNYMQLMNKLQYPLHYTLQKSKNHLLLTLILFLNVRSWETLSIKSTIFIRTLRLLWSKKVMEN